METSANRRVFFLIKNVIVYYCVGWLMSGCWGADVLIGRGSDIQITVHDSTGKPIPDFRLVLLGKKTVYPRTDILERFDLITDQAGTVRQTLSWPKGVSSYEISYDITAYETSSCFPLQAFPGGNCYIGPGQSTVTPQLITLKVKKL